MNILDLLKKYESNDSVQYLVKILGSEEYLNDIFTSTMGIKHLIDNRQMEYRFYEIFHNVYKSIENDNTIDDTIINCLIILDSFYKGMRKSIVLAQQEKKQAIKLSLDDVRIKLDERIKKMHSIDTLPKDYKYYDYACSINDDIKEYSLDLQYNLESGLNYKEGLNSVTVITPSQTISIFNDDSINGLKGSGHHEASFDKIIETVYGRKFMNSMSGQDIRIRHIAQFNKKNHKLEFKMIIEMPYVINSTQFESLSNLNIEIKKIENKLSINFIVGTVMTDFENRDFIKFIEDKINLDEVLDTVAVDDIKKDKYQEICFIGYSNLENHYNNIEYTR